MKKYRRQGAWMIQDLERKINAINLADEIIEARLERGIDRIPCDIYEVIEEIEKLQKYHDDASIYCFLVSHRKGNNRITEVIPDILSEQA